MTSVNLKIYKQKDANIIPIFLFANWFSENVVYPAWFYV